MKVGSYSFGDVTKRKIAIQLSEISKFIRKIQSKHTESLATEEQNDDAKYQRSYQPQYEFGTDCRIRLCLFKS
jgi:beta-glucosidase